MTITDVSPLVSIILPSHNGARHLPASIESCLSQTWQNSELIIVDDGSTDPQVRAIIESQTDPRVTTLILEKNVGLPAALNKGFCHARGELLTWTSDDNLYRPNAIADMIGAMRASEADFVYARASVIDEAGEVTGEIRPRPPQYLPLDNCIGACFLFTREVWETTGEYDTETLLAEDYDYWIRVSKRFRMHLIEHDLYLYRMHDASLTARHGGSKVDEIVDRTRRRHFDAARIAGAEGLRASDRGDYSEARGLLLRGFLRHPVSGGFLRPLLIVTLPKALVRAVVRTKSLLK